MKTPPHILCIGGHDPTGGAGIQADIETVNALGGRAFSLVTCLTAQDTRDIRAVRPCPADALILQAEVLMDDVRIDAIKLGILGSAETLAVVANLLEGFDGPVVLDPVLAAGGGFDLDQAALSKQIVEHLLPHTQLATPNRAELRRLARTDDETAAVRALLSHGVGAVLVTGADEAAGDQVINVLHRDGLPPRSWTWPRLPYSYHGSGCTLASACAVGLAAGQALDAAAERAQAYAWKSLKHARAVGRGQWLPERTP